jgi:lipopolysaccharide/colanic/teichoic acid biosynthesis glycosyltransferase
VNNSYHFSWQKRAFDICTSFSLVCTLLPIFLLIGLAIVITSGFPILFWQERVGKNKKPFRMAKFRTMRSDAEKIKKSLIDKNEAPWPMFKLNNDPRFTSIGKFLSRTGLDEIPQFFHILFGHMSLIGPRPLPTEEAAQLPKNWDFRYKVKPGILSHWAISPHRHKSLNTWRTLERQGIAQGSIWTDIKLLFQAAFFLTTANTKSFFRKRVLGMVTATFTSFIM